MSHNIDAIFREITGQLSFEGDRLVSYTPVSTFDLRRYQDALEAHIDAVDGLVLDDAFVDDDIRTVRALLARDFDSIGAFQVGDRLIARAGGACLIVGEDDCVDVNLLGEDVELHATVVRGDFLPVPREDILIPDFGDEGFNAPSGQTEQFSTVLLLTDARIKTDEGNEEIDPDKLVFLPLCYEGMAILRRDDK